MEERQNLDLTWCNRHILVLAFDSLYVMQDFCFRGVSTITEVRILGNFINWTFLFSSFGATPELECKPDSLALKNISELKNNIKKTRGNKIFRLWRSSDLVMMERYLRFYI